VRRRRGRPTERGLHPNNRAPSRGRTRTRVVLTTCVALLASTGLWGVILLRADATGRFAAASPDDGPLTPRQYALAVAVVRREIELDRYHVTTATAVIRRTPAAGHDHGGACRSDLISIRLTGRFRGIRAQRSHWAPAGVVTSVDVLADGTSGRSCRLTFGVGKAVPHRHAANLLAALR
jgi:hypothetical protein